MNKLIYILNYVDENDSQHFVHVMRLLASLSLRGWDVVVLSEKGGEGTRQVMGCEVRYLSKNGGGMRIPRQVWEMIKLRRKGYRLVFVRITRPAALITVLFAPLIGMKRLFWLSGTVLDFDEKKPRWQRIWHRGQLLLIVKGMTAFVTGPEKMLGYYRDKLSVPASKLRLLYNDIDLTAFPPPAPRVSDLSLRLLIVHRLSPVRQTDLYFPAILEAMEHLREEGFEVTLDVVGGGPERQILVSQLEARERALDVTFYGALPNNELNNHFDQADIFLMPSYREGFPRVLIEAMSKGLPIVSTDAGGVSDILGPQQIEFTSERDVPDRFRDNLLSLARSPATRASLRAENLSHVVRYSTPVVTSMLEELLIGVLNADKVVKK